MARQNIEISTPGDGNGDKLYFGGDKINDNFIELYLAEALNTAKVTNATHTGDVTGSGALTIANTGVTAGTYTQATVTVNAKGQVTSASSGVGSTVTKYSAIFDMNASPDPTIVNTDFTTYPYSLVILDSSGNVITHTVSAAITFTGGVIRVTMYSFDALNNCRIYMTY